MFWGISHSIEIDRAIIRTSGGTFYATMFSGTFYIGNSRYCYGPSFIAIRKATFFTLTPWRWDRGLILALLWLFKATNYLFKAKSSAVFACPVFIAIILIIIFLLVFFIFVVVNFSLEYFHSLGWSSKHCMWYNLVRTFLFRLGTI